MSTQPNIKANRYSLSVHDADTFNLINELLPMLGGNRTSVINRALDIGAPILYQRIFGKDKQSEQPTKQQHSPAVGRELKELRKVIDDVFIEMNIIETMLAGLFNALTAYLNGEEVNADALLDGSMCDLPELVAGLKEDLTRLGERNG